MNLVYRNEEGSMQLLLKRGANPDEQNNKGQTSLHITVGKGSLPCTKLLVEKGASVNIKVNYFNYMYRIDGILQQNKSLNIVVCCNTVDDYLLFEFYYFISDDRTVMETVQCTTV